MAGYMQVGSEGQVSLCRRVCHMGSWWLKAVLINCGCSFGSYQGMPCWWGVLPELRDEPERGA